METDREWILSKSHEANSHNFIKTVLSLSGYKVMNFGIENHNQEIIKFIKSNYSFETNRKLMSMPDFVVIDNDTKESFLVEIKHRNLEEFNMKEKDILFKYGEMKDYLDFWKDAILILTFNCTPYCICVDFNKVNWNIHFKERFENRKGNLDQKWNFSGIYKTLNERFPKVTSDAFKKALESFYSKNES